MKVCFYLEDKEKAVFKFSVPHFQETMRWDEDGILADLSAIDFKPDKKKWNTIDIN